MINMSEGDQILMSLVHYFVTKENYTPILVHGVKDEIWLENLNGPYRVIRISNNKIINEEQFRFDQFKIKDILRQIKKKTVSFNINALNININKETEIGNIEGLKNIDNIKIRSIQDVENNESFLEVFPKAKGNILQSSNGLELMFNVTNDINNKTASENARFEKIFSAKKIYITYVIMFLCICIFLLSFLIGGEPLSKLFQFDKGLSSITLQKMGANNIFFLRMGQVWRLVTYAFLHLNVIHLFTNMYSLYVLGTQVESKFGKIRYIIIYLISAIAGGLLSAGFTNFISVGSSGAIFGLSGAILYFGLRFRLYLKDAVKTRILPIILLNLAIGFIIPGIDNACHIGGLIAGFLSAMVVGIPNDKDNHDTINGIILLSIFLIFLSYLAFIR